MCGTHDLLKCHQCQNPTKSDDIINPDDITNPDDIINPDTPDRRLSSLHNSDLTAQLGKVVNYNYYVLKWLLVLYIQCELAMCQVMLK